MVGYETTHSVASEVFNNINGGLLDKEEQHAQEVEEVANATNVRVVWVSCKYNQWYKEKTKRNNS